MIHANLDFSPGDFSQWNGQPQMMTAGRGTIVPAPWDASEHAFRAEVKALTSLFHARTEVLTSQAKTGGYEGQAWWYPFKVWFDPTFAPDTLHNPEWDIFMQFHDLGASQPNAYFSAYSSRLDFTVVNGTTTAPKAHVFPLLTTRKNATLYEILAFAKWSQSAQAGQVYVAVNGKCVLPLRSIQTLYPAPDHGVYAKQGFYCHPQNSDIVVYQNGLQVCSDYATAIKVFKSGAWPATQP